MEDKKMKFLTTDPDYCLGCRSCELACSTAKASQYSKKSKRAVVPNIIVTQSNKKIPAHCRHCEEAYCLLLCPAKAITRFHGVVVIDDDKCTGCSICEQGCPYGVITMSTYIIDDKTKSIANKCDLCIDRQLKDKNPLCYTACPTKAIGLIEK